MSRAFIKEDDSRGEDDLGPVITGPLVLTPTELEELRNRLHVCQETAARLHDAGDLAGQLTLSHALREVRHLEEQIRAAVVLDPADQPHDRVGFGATVTVEDDHGESHRYTIVGDPDVDVAKGRISLRSPLAMALSGAQVGDTVTWNRPAGPLELTVTGIAWD